MEEAISECALKDEDKDTYSNNSNKLTREEQEHCEVMVECVALKMADFEALRIKIEDEEQNDADKGKDESDDKEYYPEGRNDA